MAPRGKILMLAMVVALALLADLTVAHDNHHHHHLAPESALAPGTSHHHHKHHHHHHQAPSNSPASAPGTSYDPTPASAPEYSPESPSAPDGSHHDHSDAPASAPSPGESGASRVVTTFYNIGPVASFGVLIPVLAFML